jgi:putative component of toxin-antitoxin plasmid stabilization module
MKIAAARITRKVNRSEKNEDVGCTTDVATVGGGVVFEMSTREGGGNR